MVEASSSTSAPAAQMGAAAQSLRDTAKWLVGGIVATAAGVFAGSSLTSLGSLDWVEDRPRLLLAGLGILVGFVGLSAILRAAVHVLNRRSLTLREIALTADPAVGTWGPEADEAREVVALRRQLERRYGHQFPDNVMTLDAYVRRVDAARRRGGTSAEDKVLLAQATRDSDAKSADGTFLLVRVRFDRLIATMGWATPLAILGFGLFAWAANPPERAAPPPAPPALSLTIQGPSGW